MLMQDRQSVGAGATVTPFQGNVHEFLEGDAMLEIAVVGAATGFTFDLTVGSRVVVQGGFASEINRIPQYPEDYFVTSGGLAGEKVTLRVNNTTGGALVLFSSCKITPA